ncbi:lipopolysaccharide biosynthesis protein [Rhodopseudomonas sp. B29]|uniref:lipopolysaccharide biosynthesis protein n=1 Tax=Rhodopseudomonas sp. B29 TaxID=95607 RepID=UPI000346C8D5|nr:lipopolysaccharide biosynthesis protein [Rhodopseudomonas sp. B29]
MKFAPAIDKLIGLRHDLAVRTVSGAFVLRVMVAVLNLALVTIAARTMSQHDFGTYSILYSAAGLLSVIATVGQQIFISRSWSEFCAAGNAGTLKGAMLFTVFASLTGVTVVSIPFFVWFANEHDVVLALAATLYLGWFSLMLISSHITRSAIGVTLGDGVTYLLMAVCPIVYLLICLVTGSAVSLSGLFMVLAAAAAGLVILHLVLMRRRVSEQFPHFATARATFDLRTWTVRSGKLWLSASLEAANQYADVVLIGYLMSPTIAGAYFVTTRIANAFSTATSAIYIFSTRHIPDLYYNRRYRELGKLLDSVALVTLAVVGGGLAAVIGGGHWILYAFNPDYVSYFGSLALLTTGTAAVAAAGPSGSILMLTGHEGRYLAIVGGTALMRALGFLALVPMFGVAGAVAATTVSFMTLALLLRNNAKSLTGIDGSVLRLLARHRHRDISQAAE